VVFSIAGWQYCSGESFIDELLERSWQTNKPLVQLEHEAGNEYDEYAVGIYWQRVMQDHKLGYVPRRHNEEIATLLALGRPIEARLFSVEASRGLDGFRGVQVEITLGAS
jgi:hypothetical protein